MEKKIIETTKTAEISRFGVMIGGDARGEHRKLLVLIARI
jgi:hypothetical protein